MAMSEHQVSRRNLLATAAAAAPAVAAPTAGVAAAPQVTLKAVGNPIKVLTMYKFEPHEIETIQRAAAEHAKVEIEICATRE